ncbi:hypothetical protein K437DRAFT_112227 [Tilletiaria anomala UBC 951]|uniref:Secreted protein n=1 Tax=Tilletiaria anomala (strain ATCC 24038 / CBS 436.72 / UBC 951) TaxID=1037660 RepID=A0A066W090_TILAU|nr:uncharacterized protein K437DRAFT_112227 [Tilletiaria anomala UBC 951]KDN45953.1 hypothetical protein K437DRAFT_112227 [Tilletiaria anomala UBC 951]
MRLSAIHWIVIKLVHFSVCPSGARRPIYASTLQLVENPERSGWHCACTCPCSCCCFTRVICIVDQSLLSVNECRLIITLLLHKADRRDHNRGQLCDFLVPEAHEGFLSNCPTLSSIVAEPSGSTSKNPDFVIIISFFSSHYGALYDQLARRGVVFFFDLLFQSCTLFVFF